MGLVIIRGCFSGLFVLDDNDANDDDDAGRDAADDDDDDGANGRADAITFIISIAGGP